MTHPRDNITPKAIVFDLDGTLLYTLEDIAAALNHGLREHGLAERSLPEVRRGVGRGLLRLVEGAVPQKTPSKKLRSILKSLNSYYRQHPVALTRPYTGIPELVDDLRNRGLYLGLLSNKDDDLVKLITEHFFPGRFSPCLGLSNAAKPNPEGLWKILRTWNLDAPDVLFIGDSEVDIETARRAGLRFLGVGWGYRDREDLHKAGADIVVHHAAEIPELMW